MAVRPTLGVRAVPVGCTRERSSDSILAVGLEIALPTFASQAPDFVADPCWDGCVASSTGPSTGA